MKFTRIAVFFGCVPLLAACTSSEFKTSDGQFGDRSGNLSNMTAGIWVDPNGCEHWIIDDGLEGYADLRRTPDGKPVCNSDLPRNVATGPFKSGSDLLDPI